MKSLLSLIQECKAGNPDAKHDLVLRMLPLLKNYASMIHFGDYEDAFQELCAELLSAIPYLDLNKTEAENIRYMETVIKNRYSKLCKHNLGLPKSEDIDSYRATLAAPSNIDDTYYDVVSYINSFPKESLSHKILSMFFYEEKSDKEIAAVLGVSRQYVNRMRKRLIKNYFLINKKDTL